MKIDLRKFRNDKGLSQSQIGELFGTKQANISMLERESRSLTPEQYNKLIDVYGEREVSKYILNDAPILSSEIVISKDVWDMITSQQQTIQSQQNDLQKLRDEIANLNKTIEVLTKKSGTAGDASTAHVG